MNFSTTFEAEIKFGYETAVLQILKTFQDLHKYVMTFIPQT